jgi:hypothetical protein
MSARTAILNRDAIRDIVRPLDPVASVYIGLVPAAPTADAAEDLSLRWRAISSELTTQGAPTATVDALGRRLESLSVYPTEMALFAAGDRVLLCHELRGGAIFDRAVFAAPAQVVPLLSWLQRHPSYVAVVTDRTGADLTAVRAGAREGTTEIVIGPDDEIERNAPGGWSQPRYQRRAEDSWRHNAAAVAEAASHALQRVGADLLLVSGDVRAAQLLEERMRDQHRHPIEVHHVPGGRQPDGSAAARRAAVAEHVASYAMERTSAVLRRFDEQYSSRGLSVAGVADTLAALAAGRVDTLIIVDDPSDERTAWFGPGVLCVDQPKPAVRVDTALYRGRLVDIAVRAALITDADVAVLDPAGKAKLADGVGAICRYR